MDKWFFEHVTRNPLWIYFLGFFVSFLSVGFLLRTYLKGISVFLKLSIFLACVLSVALTLIMVPIELSNIFNFLNLFVSISIGLCLGIMINVM